DDLDIKQPPKPTTPKLLNNTPQVSTPPTTILLPQTIKQQFLTPLKQHFTNLKLHDPLHKNTQLPPIITKKQF
ncbi:aldehyde dehydrogenase family protein, partial [Staphylococcus hominis]|uniref:aldehyde dehydrogenase family protein n=1 Tax=Staphylococcus hominis TaxID=1290 RepID=UPI0011A2DD6A